MSELEAPRAPTEIRTRGTVTDVRFAERLIDLVVIPYGERALVEHRGRLVQEVVVPGAFDGIERRPNRVRVNYQHQDQELRHLLGRVEAFHPKRPEGLVARLKIRGGEEGDLALERAEEGILAGSAGFQVMAGGEEWPTRTLRRLTRLFLEHVALTPTPAYAGAQVLAVRSSSSSSAPEPSATPNLDAVRGWRLEELAARLGGR